MSHTEMPSRRVLVVGLDGATFDLIKPRIEQGKLPNLARLMREGVHAPLRTVPTRNSGPAWSSIVSGMNPGNHGVFYLATRLPNSYATRPVQAADRQVPAIWDRLSAAGKRVLVFNVPITYPAGPVNGCLVAGMDAPGPWSPGFTHPPDLIKEIERETGRYVLWAGPEGPMQAGQPHKALAQIHRMLDCHIRAALYLLQTQPWDMGFVVFTATDVVQHYFWAYRSQPGPLQSAIFDVYDKLDGTIGRCLELSGDEATVIVLSDHGAGPEQPARHLVNDLLADLGLLQRKKRDVSHRALRRAFLAGLKWLGEPLKLKLMQHLPRLYRRVRSELHVGNIDWGATRAFSQGIGSFVWLNVRGRDPQGIVEPGAEYEALRTWLREVLLSVRDPLTGQVPLRAVYRREEIYAGPFQERAADLVLDWSDVPCNGLRCEVEGRVITADQGAGDRLLTMTGDHSDLGILIARGPAVRAGAELPVCHLADIAPTLLHMSGQPVPPDLDGRVLFGMFRETYRPPAQTAGQAAPSITPVAGERTLSPEEKKIVEDRLRALGYLD
jgi:predicted AlkP superfamily phosphohydrolase/phosphomutase